MTVGLTSYSIFNIMLRSNIEDIIPVTPFTVRFKFSWQRGRDPIYTCALYYSNERRAATIASAPQD